MSTIHISSKSLEEMQFFEAIFEMFGRTVFEVSEVKRGLMVKKQDFEAEVLKLKSRNNFQKLAADRLSFISSSVRNSYLRTERTPAPCTGEPPGAAPPNVVRVFTLCACQNLKFKKPSVHISALSCLEVQSLKNLFYHIVFAD